MRPQPRSKNKANTINKTNKTKPGGTGVAPVSPELRITRRNLPHWHLGGATYFVTFRVKNKVLSQAERSLVVDACRHWHKRKWRLWAAVVMSDHVHLLVQPLPCGKKQWYALGEILHSVKSYTAHQINKRRKTTGAVWLDESFDRIVRNEGEFKEKLLYMSHNPIKAGLAGREGEYPYFWQG